MMILKGIRATLLLVSVGLIAPRRRNRPRVIRPVTVRPTSSAPNPTCILPIAKG